MLTRAICIGTVIPQADTPSSVAVKVAAITRTGVRGSGMWTANAFHRRDRALSAQAATALFETMATEA